MRKEALTQSTRRYVKVSGRGGGKEIQGGDSGTRNGKIISGKSVTNSGARKNVLGKL